MAFPHLRGEQAGLIGTYTSTRTEGRSGSPGIYRYRFNSLSGRFLALEPAAATANPSYLAWGPDGSHCYAVNEIGLEANEPQGQVTAWHFANREHLRQQSQWDAMGAMPCCLAVDPKGRTLFCTSYEGGSLSVFRIRRGGALTPVVARILSGGVEANNGSRFHHVRFVSDGRYAVVSDFGSDRIGVYRIQEDGIPANQPVAWLGLPNGSKPRSMDGIAASSSLYSLQQGTSKVAHLRWDEGNSRLSLLSETPCLPSKFREQNYPSLVHVGPGGRFLYASNRGHNSLAVWPIERDGSLHEAKFYGSGGSFPRHFAFDHSGQWLLCANQYSNRIAVFAVDSSDGSLSLHSMSDAVPAPAFVLPALTQRLI